MKRFTMFVSLALALVFAIGSFAADLPNYTSNPNATLTGINFDSAATKASRDTFVLIGPWGSEPAGAKSQSWANGQFQSTAGAPAWNGWTSNDITQPDESQWSVSDFNAAALDPSIVGNLAAYCGNPGIPACSTDLPGGYGNNWNEILEWSGTVANPAAAVTVNFDAVVSYECENGWDFLRIQYMDLNESPQDVATYTAAATAEVIDLTFTVAAEDFHGTLDDQVILRINFTSDASYSDADCLSPTNYGAVQMDNVVVSLDQGSGAFLTSTTDFEDGTFGDWEITYPLGVGDFAQIWTNLDDVDPCASNYGTQVAFIDDGLIVPGVGPSVCQEWCYGPNGYIVNTEGGQLGPDAHINCAVESPALEWPDPALDGCFLQFEAYRHETLALNSAGIFYTWSVRSVDGLETELKDQAWVDRNFVYYGGPDYLRTGFVITDLLANGRDFVQVQLAVYELGYAFSPYWDGSNGFPAPYFDNVRMIAYPAYGPSWATREIDLANDNFPTQAEVNMEDPGSNDVRFDMARNISPSSELLNDPGDSLIVDVVSVRAGAELTGAPEMVWALNPNPIFDAYRTSVLGTATSGVITGDQVYQLDADSNLVAVPDRFSFDMPDEDFLYPGDVLHYFFRATDTVGGGDAQTTTLPFSEQDQAEPDGFGDFSGPLTYNSSYTVRALPTIIETSTPGEYTQPSILFWNDFADRGGEAEWHGALANLGLLVGRDYDVYYTNGPSSGVGNGLGGRASRFSISGYDDMLYTCGNLSVMTLANGDAEADAHGDDITLLDDWLLQGGKDLFLTGDDLVYDLTQNVGASGADFVNDWIKVDYVSSDLRPLINNQTTPIVRAIDDNSVFLDGEEWVAYGGCFSVNTFDAVTLTPGGGGEKLAEFLSPEGATEAYGYSAATLYNDVANSARVISMPYDFMYIYTSTSADKAPAALPMRATVLERVLGYFGIDPTLDTSGVEDTPAVAFKTSVYPNPFNPTTKIQYTMPKAGHLTLKIYNVKGELVKTLIDESVEAGQNHIMWDGTNQSGAKVSSGVYFSEARTAGQVKVNKMALVK